MNQFIFFILQFLLKMALPIVVGSDELATVEMCLTRKLAAEKKTINRLLHFNVKYINIISTLFFYRYIVESYGPNIVNTLRSNVRSICPACKPDFRSWNWGPRQRRRTIHVCGWTCAEILEQECEEVIQVAMWSPDRRSCLDKVRLFTHFYSCVQLYLSIYLINSSSLHGC